MSEVPLFVWFIMYLSAGWVYMIHSPLASKYRDDIVLCIWLLWLPFFVWDIIKSTGKALMNIFEFILELLD